MIPAISIWSYNKTCMVGQPTTPLRTPSPLPQEMAY